MEFENPCDDPNFCSLYELYSPHFGKNVNYEDKQYMLQGIMVGIDDYFYVLLEVDTNVVNFTSCVFDIELIDR